MMEQRAPELDMLPDGSFRQPAKPPVATRVFFWAVLIASIAGALAFAAFALWIALIILPVALGAAVVAWLAFRFQLWRAGISTSRRSAEGGPQDLWRR
jgi:hypothetical protein